MTTNRFLRPQYLVVLLVVATLIVIVTNIRLLFTSSTNDTIDRETTTEQSLAIYPVLYKITKNKKTVSLVAKTADNNDEKDGEIIVSKFIQQTKRKLIASQTTTAWPNLTTYAYARKEFIAGYRNQIMALTMLVLQGNDLGHGQLLLDSLYHKDTYGTNKFDSFMFYFDVQHWNTYHNNTEIMKHTSNTTSSTRQHPKTLPRLVYYDPILHSQWNTTTNQYVDEVMNGIQPAIKPYGYSKGSTRLAMSYQRYVKGYGKYVSSGAESKRNPGEILMLQGAIKPHPVLQSKIDNLLHDTMKGNNHNTNKQFSYMTLHARIEPDMQKHLVCKEKKVLRLKEIIDMVETKFPIPPNIDWVFLPINRQYLEKEGMMVSRRGAGATG